MREAGGQGDGCEGLVPRDADESSQSVGGGVGKPDGEAVADEGVHEDGAEDGDAARLHRGALHEVVHARVLCVGERE